VLVAVPVAVAVGVAVGVLVGVGKSQEAEHPSPLKEQPVTTWSIGQNPEEVSSQPPWVEQAGHIWKSQFALSTIAHCGGPLTQKNVQHTLMARAGADSHATATQTPMIALRVISDSVPAQHQSPPGRAADAWRACLTERA